MKITLANNFRARSCQHGLSSIFKFWCQAYAALGINVFPAVVPDIASFQ